MAPPSAQFIESESVHDETKAKLWQKSLSGLKVEPMRPTGILDQFESFDVTPNLGREFPTARLLDWLNAPNSDDLIRELAVTISRRGVVFFRAQDGVTDEVQKRLVQRMGELTNKPKSSTLHILPLANGSTHGDPNVNIITTDKKLAPAEDIFKLHATRPLGIGGPWHSDGAYEPCPPDYSCLRFSALPKVGGDTIWASACQVFEKITPTYRRFLESLTVTMGNDRHGKTAEEKGFDLYTDPRGSPENHGSSLTTVHPVVRTNPVTGWKSLFGVGHHFVRYNELSALESQRVHDYLMTVIVEGLDCQLRHSWQNVNDMAIWDNRSTFHAANADFEGQGVRTAHRVVGIAERPYLDPRSTTRREALDIEARS